MDKADAAPISEVHIPSSHSEDCPSAVDMAQRHLLGRWHVQWHDRATALLELRPHPELEESVRGTLTRNDGSIAAVAGDVHEGFLTLEESDDGRRISGTWLGDVREGHCAQEIEGTWSNTPESQIRGFTLRKQASAPGAW